MEKKSTGFKSFGIPEEIRPQSKRETPPPTPPSASAPTTHVEEESATLTDAMVSEIDNAEKIFNLLGIKFTDDDFQQLLFTGTFEKEVEIVKGKFAVVFNMLKTSDYDIIDEITADDIGDKKMTNEGLQLRKQATTIATVVLKIGMPGKTVAVVKPKALKKGEQVDTKALIIERRDILRQLAPSVFNIIVSKHAALCAAVDIVVKNPGDLAKNS